MKNYWKITTFPLSLTWILLCLIAPTVSAEGLRIIFDYRFDGGFFSRNPERKIPLEYSAKIWEKVLMTAKVVHAGTMISVRESFTTNRLAKISFPEAVPGFVIFVYAFDFAKQVDEYGNPDPSDSKAFSDYFQKETPIGYLAINTHADRPWFFDTTPEDEYDVPVKSFYDFITTGIHEMGHVLGFLGDRKMSLVKTFGPKDERFVGPATVIRWYSMSRFPRTMSTTAF
ncbi:MAG: hypothetical protein HQM08_23325 [Candidatus Riflebacteria bacterium]|nr:hypothetical protein [Candidatus Riflebacteria bacterium]